MTDLQEAMKKLVLARLEMLPNNKKMSIGSSGEFSRDEMIEHVKKGDALGKKIIEIEMEFLQALKKRALYG
ncbi:MAG: hypothetical protein QT08_C0020G0033 [archaeon GW2011_AR17]|nr:MAG: hypothetical protein QT08_C0020G0033 [archaeon GW2011_AR17]MBS3154046.1 hypothetical protein [Candidatus Woesearchaeota archaeon]HIH15564.1 hypothetical protein [Nanoarchaeota archaeon]HIH59104.1 hypothetical protein [Nanoarchaeota archaeon]HII14608.1 hypothetical protein [Nanoarchaeota archaeon]